MSTFSLTKGSEAALGMLASQAGSETLLLTQPARELRAELSIEPFTSDSGDQLLAVLLMREQRHSMTLQRDDGANAQHLADWIEAVANGTVDTAEAIPQRADPSGLVAATAAFNAAAHELNAQAEAAPAQTEQQPAAPCDHQWTDDGLHLLVCTSCGAQENHDPGWQDMDTAPRDGTLVQLLVEFDEHATEHTDGPAPTIGANNYDNDGEDRWQFAGWCWSHDHFTEGHGTPVGWLPIGAPIAQTAPQPEQSVLVTEAMRNAAIAEYERHDGDFSDFAESVIRAALATSPTA